MSIWNKKILNELTCIKVHFNIFWIGWKSLKCRLDSLKCQTSNKPHSGSHTFDCTRAPNYQSVFSYLSRCTYVFPMFVSLSLFIVLDVSVCYSICISLSVKPRVYHSLNLVYTYFSTSLSVWLLLPVRVSIFASVSFSYHLSNSWVKSVTTDLLILQ